MTKTKTLTIGWLYPDLMSTYGDRGNILVLKHRAALRDITVTIVPIEQSTKIDEIKKIDILFGGGAQDREQDIVMRDLKGKKGESIKKIIEEGIPALFVCGAPQLMGNYYEPAVGQKIEGVGIFDMDTINPGPDAPRLIGNIVATVQWKNFTLEQNESQTETPIVGFENHGGRTYLGKNAKPFATVLSGNGNNGEDKTEGVVYKNAIGCYFHGPLLPKNPEIADWLLKTALEKKYGETPMLLSLDDSLENQARRTIAKRLGVSI